MAEQKAALDNGLEKCLEIVEAASQNVDGEELQSQIQIQVKKEEEQLSMDDGPSFVSPNGSFEHSNIVRG